MWNLQKAWLGKKFQGNHTAHDGINKPLRLPILHKSTTAKSIFTSAGKMGGHRRMPGTASESKHKLFFPPVYPYRFSSHFIIASQFWAGSCTYYVFSQSFQTCSDIRDWWVLQTDRVHTSCSLIRRIGSEYKILYPIGKGAYGLVAAALHTPTGTKVAIKRITPFDHTLLFARIEISEILLGRPWSKPSTWLLFSGPVRPTAALD